MDIRFLESFTQVASHGSFAEAARRLGLTPAAIAQRIRALESDVGAALVVRSGRTVRLTPTGEKILQRAQNLLREVRELRSEALSDDIAGELRLGAISTAITGLLPGVLSRLIALHPKLEPYIVPGTSVDLYRKVLDGELDAAVLVEPPFALPKTCNWRVLRREPIVLIAPEAMKGRAAIDLLATEPFIRYDRNHWGGRLADGCLRQLGVHPRERFELDALDAIAVLVDRRLGVSLVPDWAPPWPENLRLTKIALPGRPVSRQIGLVWSNTSARGRLVRAVLHETETVARASKTAKGRFPKGPAVARRNTRHRHPSQP